MQQRGVAASQEVLQAILDGVLEQGPARVHCVDLVPSRPGEIALQEWLTLARYNEWGRAVLQHQKQALTSAQSHVYHFTAYGITAEEKEFGHMKSEVAAELMAALPSDNAFRLNSGPRTGGTTVRRLERRLGRQPGSRLPFRPCS